MQTLHSIKCPLCVIYTLRGKLGFHVQDCIWNWEYFEKYTSPSTLDRDVKAMEESSFKFVTEDK